MPRPRPAGASPDQGGYRPDPAADTRALIDAFFAALADALPEQEGLTARLRTRHERLLLPQQHRIVDEPSRYNLASTLAVLAAYQELTVVMPDERLLPLLRAAFVEPLRAQVHDGTRAALDAAADPFATMVEFSRQREEHFFGAGFTFTHPADDRDRYVAQVERCYYHQVLAASGAAHLTPVFCAFDANWIDAIDPEWHGFAFERPTTIGTGGPNCPFRFHRTRPGPER